MVSAGPLTTLPKVLAMFPEFTPDWLGHGQGWRGRALVGLVVRLVNLGGDRQYWECTQFPSHQHGQLNIYKILNEITDGKWV